MTLRACSIALLAILVAAGPALAPAPVVAQGKDVFIPLLVYRTGPFAPSGIPIANGVEQNASRQRLIALWQVASGTDVTAAPAGINPAAR